MLMTDLHGGAETPPSPDFVPPTPHDAYPSDPQAPADTYQVPDAAAFRDAAYESDVLSEPHPALHASNLTEAGDDTDDSVTDADLRPEPPQPPATEAPAEGSSQLTGHPPESLTITDADLQASQDRMQGGTIEVDKDDHLPGSVGGVPPKLDTKAAATASPALPPAEAPAQALDPTPEHTALAARDAAAAVALSGLHQALPPTAEADRAAVLPSLPAASTEPPDTSPRPATETDRTPGQDLTVHEDPAPP